MLWNVSGFDAVELDLPGGRRFRVGTDEPTELVAAISRARGVAASPPPSTVPGERGALVRWLPLLAVLGLLAAVLVPLFWFQMRPPGVSVSPEGFEVSTPFYGARFAASEIEAISLEPRLPRVLARTNGFAAAGSLRGHFRLEGLGQGRLYVEQGHAPRRGPGPSTRRWRARGRSGWPRARPDSRATTRAACAFGRPVA